MIQADAVLRGDQRDYSRPGAEEAWHVCQMNRICEVRFLAKRARKIVVFSLRRRDGKIPLERGRWAAGPSPRRPHFQTNQKREKRLLVDFRAGP